MNKKLKSIKNIREAYDEDIKNFLGNNYCSFLGDMGVMHQELQMIGRPTLIHLLQLGPNHGLISLWLSLESAQNDIRSMVEERIKDEDE